MDENKEERSYETGYRKPPRNRQFQPGKSGNPKGRPKGSKNLGTILFKELNTRIPVTENGKQKQLTKQEAIVKSTVNNALRGDHKATAVIWSDLKSREEHSGGSGGPTADGFTITPEDELVMASIVDRILSFHSKPIESAATGSVVPQIGVAPGAEGDDN